MGSESEQERRNLTSTPPKLSLFALPSNKAFEPPEMLTPPVKTLASVPFQWEEAPGKPRPCCVGANNDGENKPKSVVKCLELPPRLLTEAKVSHMPSPTTVLDGPYGGGAGSKSLGHALAFRKGGSSFRCPPAEKEKVLFGSSRWGSLKKNNKEVVEVGGGFDFLFSDIKGEASAGRSNDDCYRDGTKVNITRVKKRSVSFRRSISQTKSNNLLTSIYERFKHVVPLSWSRRRRQGEEN